MVTAAATLHAAGKTDYPDLGASRRSAAPDRGGVRGSYFCVGIVGTGLLAIRCSRVQPLTRSGGRRWPVGLAAQAERARRLFSADAVGSYRIALNFTSINPISALYWSAVINRRVAVPVMVLLMIMARRKDVMGHFVVGGPLHWLGWLSTAAMLLSVLAMAVGFFLGGK